MRERSTRILSPIRNFSPASTRGGWNRCGTATSRWVTRFSTSRTLSARRTIRRAAGHGVTNTSGALCRIAGAPSLARRRETLSGPTSGCYNRRRRAASDDEINFQLLAAANSREPLQSALSGAHNRLAARRADQLASLKPFATRNATFFDALLALIWISSPVAGLRPLRAGRASNSYL